jgi:hypothetical protein
MFTKNLKCFLAVAALLLSAVSAQAAITVVGDYDFTNNTLNGWGAGGPGFATASPAGAVLGTVFPGNGETEDKEGNISHGPLSLSYSNSGMEMIFTPGSGTKGGGYSYLEMWNTAGGGDRRGFAINSNKTYDTIILRQILADGSWNDQNIAAPIGFGVGQEHSLALVAFDNDTIAAYMDGVQIGSPLALAAPLPATGPNPTLQQLGIGVNSAGSDWYIPQGTVVSRARAFTFASGEFSAGDLLTLNANGIPEPSTFALSALALFSLGFVGWRRRRR